MTSGSAFVSTCPRKAERPKTLSGEPKLPVELEGALLSLYGNYEKYYRIWEQNTEARARGITPPVFIVVCNNTNVSKMVFDYIGGWEKQIADRTDRSGWSIADLSQ